MHLLIHQICTSNMIHLGGQTSYMILISVRSLEQKCLKAIMNHNYLHFYQCFSELGYYKGRPEVNVLKPFEVVFVCSIREFYKNLL